MVASDSLTAVLTTGSLNNGPGLPTNMQILAIRRHGNRGQIQSAIPCRYRHDRIVKLYDRAFAVLVYE